MRHIPAAQRFHADHGWLQSNFLLSFAHYFDPENLHFGALRVFNDDEIAPRAGFPQHPHAEMEIVTIVLDGAVTHHDSLGNQTTIRAGEVQRMTAGTGLQHSEMNRGSEPVHLYQLWFLPTGRGLQPSYEQRAIPFLTRRHEWVALVSGRGDGAGQALFLNADATVWWANLEPGRPLPYAADEDRNLLVYVAGGTVTLNGQRLETNDQARLTGEQHLTFAATEPASVVLVDVG